MDRAQFIEKGLMEDWEYSDQELLDRLHRLLFMLRADPFNGQRKTDAECRELVIHAGERAKAIKGIEDSTSRD